MSCWIIFIYITIHQCHDTVATGSECYQGHIYLPAGNLIQECFKSWLYIFVSTNPINALATELLLEGPYIQGKVTVSITPLFCIFISAQMGVGSGKKGNNIKLPNISACHSIVIEICFFPLQINVSVTNHWRKFITPITPEKSVTTVVNDWFGRLLTALNFPWVVN